MKKPYRKPFMTEVFIRCAEEECTCWVFRATRLMFISKVAPDEDVKKLLRGIRRMLN